MEEDQVDHPVYVIKRVGKRNTISECTLEEQTITNQRIKACGERFEIAQKFIASKYGSKVSFNKIKKVAALISKYTHLKIDRLSNRNKLAMYCWFAERWEIIFPILIWLNNDSDDPQPLWNCNYDSKPINVSATQPIDLLVPTKRTVGFQSFSLSNLI